MPENFPQCDTDVCQSSESRSVSFRELPMLIHITNTLHKVNMECLSEQNSLFQLIFYSLLAIIRTDRSFLS